MMTMAEARQIGEQKLRLHPEVMRKAAQVAQQMEVKREHLPPMILALSVMGVAKATDPKELEGELTDALALVSQAEKEWRFDQVMQSQGRKI